MPTPTPAPPLLCAPRRLTRDAAPQLAQARYSTGIKVNPRGGHSASGVGERPGRIADGVRAALADWAQALLLAGLLFLTAIRCTVVGHGGDQADHAGALYPGRRDHDRALCAGAEFSGALRPILLGSVPLAAVGGAVHLPGNPYRPVVGAILLPAAIRLLWFGKRHADAPPTDRIHLPPALVSGARNGFLSGLTGTGDGIFLSPALLRPLAGHAPDRRGAIASTPVNSIAGLAGNLADVRSLPLTPPLWMLAATIGGGV